MILAGGPQVTQGPDIAAGAKLNARTAEFSLPIPAGSIVSLPPPTPGALEFRPTLTLAAPSTLTGRETSQEATGPTTHAPPAPPSPAELAAGTGIRIFYYLAAALALIAIVCFYTGHTKAGAIAAIGAGALPLLASVSTYLATHSLVAIVCLSGALVAAWFLVRSKLKPDPHEIPPPPPIA